MPDKENRQKAMHFVRIFTIIMVTNITTIAYFAFIPQATKFGTRYYMRACILRAKFLAIGSGVSVTKYVILPPLCCDEFLRSSFWQ